ncbi:MAG: glycosyltransferase family 4 protein [Halioglobus sp.]
MMRLALLLYDHNPHTGVQRDVRCITQALTIRGHHCRVYCLSWQGDVLDGMDLCLVPVSAGSRRGRSARFLQWVRNDLTNTPVDGIIGFNKMPGLDIYFTTSACYLEKAQQRGRLYRRSAHFRHFAECEHAVFAPPGKTQILLQAESQRDAYAKHYRLQPERMHVVPPGVSPEWRLPEDAPQRRKAVRAQLGLEAQELTLLCVGSQFVAEGLDYAVTAFSRLRMEQPSVKARLLVVGQGKYKPFQRLSRKLGVAESVEFLGDRNDVMDIMLGADLLLYPARGEAVGSVLLEALVAGLPVVATEACGYAPQIKAARAGIVLHSPLSQEDLDRAVMRFIDGIFRADCRSSALLYTRLTDMYSKYSQCAHLIEQLLHSKHETHTQ